MDYIADALVFGIDALVFGICYNLYLKKKAAVGAIKNAPVYDSELEEKLRSDGIIPYCAIRGTIKALGVPIFSLNAPNITGVVQKLSIKQHVIARGSAGFWVNREQTVQEVYNAVPFGVVTEKSSVEFLDVLSVEVLDLETLVDRFEPSPSSFTEHLWGFVSGVRQHGLQSTEEMLREGSLVTAIGEVTYDGKGFSMQPPIDGAPYYLTSMPINTLIRKIDEDRQLYRNLTIITGGIGVFLSCLIAWNWWKKYKEEMKKKDLKRKLEASRKERRQRNRDVDIPDSQRCVVCQENPREIIVLPCGHVCLCEDCSENIDRLCPVCRSDITSRAAAYLA